MANIYESWFNANQKYHPKMYEKFSELISAHVEKHKTQLPLQFEFLNGGAFALKLDNQALTLGTDKIILK